MERKTPTAQSCQQMMQQLANEKQHSQFPVHIHIVAQHYIVTQLEYKLFQTGGTELTKCFQNFAVLNMQCFPFFAKIDFTFEFALHSCSWKKITEVKDEKVQKRLKWVWLAHCGRAEVDWFQPASTVTSFTGCVLSTHQQSSTHQLSPPAYQQTTISDCVPSDAEYHQPSTITATIKLTKWKWIQIASSISWYLIPNFFTFPQQHKSCPSYYSAWHTMATKSFVLSLSLSLSWVHKVAGPASPGGW